VLLTFLTVKREEEKTVVLTLVLLTFSTVKTEEGKTVFLTLVLLTSFRKTRRRKQFS
jgi:hypothetical protein